MKQQHGAERKCEEGAYLWTARNWGRGVTEWKEETEECVGEKQRDGEMESQAADFVCVRGQAGAESLMDGVQGCCRPQHNPVNRTASTGLASPARQNFLGFFSPGNGKAERVQGDI
ncbi:hypothetical protein F7725_009070 [Dissostichus mawsoni]|uniref:Uncharacterized protein n=1 Tax=Dissostichus mawsoni TaxID=36200 RepID=A0A7J5Z7T4_DISMA|nr:hypothetical protein F7725_009070 [Dissostichus mawsoni]